MFSTTDLHMHTTYSDGAASVRAVVEHVATCTPFRVVAITDHDTTAGAREAQRYASQAGIEVIIGSEISTAQGHLLALFIERDIPPGQSVAATIRAIHAQGGLAIAAHPYDVIVPSMGRHGLLAHVRSGLWNLDGIEAFNASLWLPRNNVSARAAVAQLGIAALGGSDSHHLNTIGSGYTRFPGSSASDLYRAIQTAQTVPDGTHWSAADQALIIRRWVVRESLGLARTGWRRVLSGGRS